jgi:hypothetical protein
MRQYSAIPFESEILNVASTSFKTEGVEYIDLRIEKLDCLSVVTIPVVKMSYFLSWSDFEIHKCPPAVMIESDAM